MNDVCMQSFNVHTTCGRKLVESVKYVRFKVIKVVVIKIQVFWEVNTVQTGYFCPKQVRRIIRIRTVWTKWTYQDAKIRSLAFQCYVLYILISIGQCLNSICTSDECSWMTVLSRIPRIWPVITICVFSLFFPFSSLHKQTQMLSCIQSKRPINMPTSYWDWYSSHQIRGCKHLYLVQLCAYHQHTISQFCSMWAGIKTFTFDETISFCKGVLCEIVVFLMHKIFLHTQTQKHTHTHTYRNTKIYRHTHTHKHTHTYRYTQTHPHIQTHTDIYTPTQTHTDIYTHTQTHAHTYRITQTHPHTHPHIQTHTDIYTPTQTHTDIYTHRHTHTHTHTHTYRITQTHPHTHTHTHTHIYIYIYMYITIERSSTFVTQQICMCCKTFSTGF
jgi:hypothetical protein